MPMTGDVSTAGNPDSIVALHIIQKSLQSRDPPRPPGETTVQTHRHHSRLFQAFSVQNVKGIAKIIKVIRAADESGC